MTHQLVRGSQRLAGHQLPLLRQRQDRHGSRGGDLRRCQPYFSLQPDAGHTAVPIKKQTASQDARFANVLVPAFDSNQFVLWEIPCHCDMNQRKFAPSLDALSTPEC